MMKAQNLLACCSGQLRGLCKLWRSALHADGQEGSLRRMPPGNEIARVYMVPLYRLPWRLHFIIESWWTPH
eukprot:5548124-Amphidinium_carterae.1